MNLGSFSIAMPTPVLGESHHQAKGAPGLVTCSNPGHRAQAKAGPSGRPSPALHSPTFPSPPGRADRARPLPLLHQSASGAAPVAQEGCGPQPISAGALGGTSPAPSQNESRPAAGKAGAAREARGPRGPER